MRAGIGWVGVPWSPSHARKASSSPVSLLKGRIFDYTIKCIKFLAGRV